MGTSRHVGRVGGLAVALGLGAAVLAGAAAAWASPDSESSEAAPSHPASAQSARHSARLNPAAGPKTRAAHTVSPAAPMSISATPNTVTIDLPAMPVTKGASFTVSADFMKGFAADYVAGGGDPTDSAHFFFGDLAVASLDALADPDVTPEQTRLLLGNLAASG